MGALLSVALLGSPVSAEEPTTNQVPNFEFRGTSGTKVFAGSGMSNGDVPALWRSFALDGGNVTTEIVPLAANTLYPGSPATNAVRFTVHSFATDGAQAFDHSDTIFTLDEDEMYSARVYMRSDNADASSQVVQVGVPLFNTDGTFLGVAPGSFEPTVPTSWTEYTGPQFTAFAQRATHLSFRPIDDGGDDSILIALPEIIGQPLSNRVPNPGFEGTGGLVTGDVTGPIPEDWRGFAVNGGAITTAIVPVAANELYPGSPATNAVQVTVDTFDPSGGGQGFDHEGTLLSLQPPRRIWSEVWLKSGNVDSSSQDVLVQVPVFDSLGVFTGTTANTYIATTTTEWNYFGGTSFLTEPGTLADISFRPLESGVNNSFLIALPRINGIPIVLVDDGFESP